MSKKAPDYNLIAIIELVIIIFLLIPLTVFRLQLLNCTPNATCTVVVIHTGGSCIDPK